MAFKEGKEAKKKATSTIKEGTMLNATVELFMGEYYLVKTVLGRRLADERALFSALGKIFLVPAGEADGLYALAENELARGINTEKEFMQHKRIMEYSHIVGEKEHTDPDWEEAATVKGNAILLAEGYKLLPPADAAGNAVYGCLTAAAQSGVVAAIRMTGILQAEGIFLAKNERAALKNLKKAADWNDVVGTLALLCYDKEGRGYNVARLRREVKGTPFEELYLRAEKAYGAADGVKAEEVRLLNKAFSSGVLKRDSYDAKYSRILNGKALHIRDKEKAVFSPSREFLSVVAELPVKLSRENIRAVDTSALKDMVINREEERAEVARAVKNADLRALPDYRPVCFSCDSRYVLNSYAKAIGAKCAGVHCETVDVALLGEYDFEPSASNVFVRNLDEDCDNRLMLFFCGDISERKAEAVKKILVGASRSEFRLYNPGVTLDLSSVLPVCFSDSRNARILKEFCDVISLPEITESELPAAVLDIIAAKREVYGVGEVSLSGGAEEVFRGLDADAAEKFIDAALRARRGDGAAVVLSRENILEYGADAGAVKIGFGGAKNERL